KDLDEGWMLFYSGVAPSVCAQAGVGILTSPRLASRGVEWMPISSRAIAMRLTLVGGKNLAIVQAYAPNTEAEYTTFLDELDGGLSRLHPTDSLILMGDFNAHVGTDTETWRNVIGRNGDAHLSRHRSSWVLGSGKD